MTTKLTASEVKLVEQQALREIHDEDFRARVDAEKARRRNHVPWWHKVFPWKITIDRRR
jgi:hypothetical protein